MVGYKIEGLNWKALKPINGGKEWCLAPDEDLETITELINNSQWSHLSVVRTGFAIHLMEPQLSKGSGLKIILDKMGLTPEDLLCVGDAPNDLSMFEIAIGQLLLEERLPMLQNQPMLHHLFHMVKLLLR